jgi:hypothetical protein
MCGCWKLRATFSSSESTSNQSLIRQTLLSKNKIIDPPTTALIYMIVQAEFSAPVQFWGIMVNNGRL